MFLFHEKVAGAVRRADFEKLSQGPRRRALLETQRSEKHLPSSLKTNETRMWTLQKV